MCALNELKKLCDEATEAPWRKYERTTPDDEWELYSPGHHEWVAHTVKDADAQFIAAARTHLPLLLSKLEAVGELVHRIMGWKECHDPHPGDCDHCALDAILKGAD